MRALQNDRLDVSRSENFEMIDDDRAIEAIIAALDPSLYATTRRKANATKARRIWNALRELSPISASATPTTMTTVEYSLPFVEEMAKRYGCRVVKEDRIKTIAACTYVDVMSRVPETERKFAHERMIKNIGEQIAERLLTFDKMRLINYGDKEAPPHLQPTEAMIVAKFNVIVPERKPK